MFRSKPTAPLIHPRKLIATALILASHVGVVLAGPTARIDIPAQPLSSALRVLASQAGIQLVFTPETVGAAKGRAIKGEMSAEDALRQLLVGSGLELRQDGERNYVVVRKTQTEHSMAEMVVTATRTERRIDEVPASVTVITASDISRQQASKVEDMLRRVPGIDVNSNPATGFNGDLFMRGVGGSSSGVTTQMLVNGIATDSIVSTVAGRGGLNFTPFQEIERIEILRGPSSALYGPTAVGGVINVIPKRWSGAPGAEVYLDQGSHNFRSAGVAAGAANDSADIRLSAVDASSSGFVARPFESNVTGQRGKDLAGRDWRDTKFGVQIGLRPSASQELTFSLQDYTNDAAVLGGHPNNRVTNTGTATTFAYRHELGETATAKLAYRLSRVRSFTTFDKSSTTLGDLSLNYNYDRNSVSHSLDGQVDWRTSRNNLLTVGFSYGVGKINTTAKKPDGTIFGNVQDVSEGTDTAVFVQDELKVTDALTAILGGRYDRIHLFGDTRSGTPRFPSSQESVFNPRGGLMYAFSPATSGYASYSTAFIPALNNLKAASGLSATFADNPDLKPERSKSIEFGVNHRVMGGVLHAAMFRTDYTDKIGLRANAVGTKSQYQNIGLSVAKGVELSFDTKLSGGWELYANYTYTQAKIVDNPNNLALVGHQLQRIAPRKLNFGIAYAPRASWLVSFGGRCSSARFFGDENTPDQRGGGFCVADAKVSTQIPGDQFGKWNAYLALNNLSDKQYVDYMGGTDVVNYADRRTVMVGVNGKF